MRQEFWTMGFGLLIVDADCGISFLAFEIHGSKVWSLELRFRMSIIRFGILHFRFECCLDFDLLILHLKFGFEILDFLL